MEVTNELTRPFRIPRKNRNDVDDQQQQQLRKNGELTSFMHNDVTRSPLAASAPTNRNLYGRRIVPIKRRYVYDLVDVYVLN